MATITVKQLLHRVAPGVAIGPANPLEVRQFDGSGQPIAPATETTLAALKTEVDKLAGLIDSDALKVALSGSIGSPVRLLEDVVITAGSSTPFVGLGSSAPFIGFGIRLDENREFVLEARHHDPISGMIVSDIVKIITRDNPPSDRGTGLLEMFTGRIQWRVRNIDSQDITVRTLVATDYYTR